LLAAPFRTIQAHGANMGRNLVIAFPTGGRTRLAYSGCPVRDGKSFGDDFRESKIRSLLFLRSKRERGGAPVSGARRSKWCVQEERCLTRALEFSGTPWRRPGRNHRAGRVFIQSGGPRRAAICADVEIKIALAEIADFVVDGLLTHSSTAAADVGLGIRRRAHYPTNWGCLLGHAFCCARCIDRAVEPAEAVAPLPDICARRIAGSAERGHPRAASMTGSMRLAGASRIVSGIGQIANEVPNRFHGGGGGDRAHAASGFQSVEHSVPSQPRPPDYEDKLNSGRGTNLVTWSPSFHPAWR